MCARMCVLVGACEHMHVCLCAYVHSCLNMFWCMRAWPYACGCVLNIEWNQSYMNAYMLMWIQIYTHEVATVCGHACTRMVVHMCMCNYTCVHVSTHAAINTNLRRMHINLNTSAFTMHKPIDVPHMRWLCMRELHNESVCACSCVYMWTQRHMCAHMRAYNHAHAFVNVYQHARAYWCECISTCSYWHM